jgi:flagellar hook-basal body complex protein FliE
MLGAASAVQGAAATIQSTLGPDAASGLSTGGAAAPFGHLFRDTVEQVNAMEDQAHAAVEGLMTGSGVDVHRAMIATQKAEMAFELALSVRNKAVQAYQQVMGMQF